MRAVDVNGLSPFEAAEMLVLPLGTVKSRLRSARHKLVELARELVPPSQWGTK